MKSRLLSTIVILIILISGINLIIPNANALRYSIDTDLSNVDASYLGVTISDRAGYSVSSAGDVNGDGFDDFLIGAYMNDEGQGDESGQTYLILGNSSGWSMDNNLSFSDASFYGQGFNDMSGISVAGVSDVNGDGFDDFIIGAKGSDRGTLEGGQTYLIFGRQNGWSMGMYLFDSNASFVGEGMSDYSGEQVGPAGDVNGDGYHDFLIGAWRNWDGGYQAGKAYLILGKSSGWKSETDLSEADASFIGEASEDRAGFSVRGAGDVNGDGFDDILIGAPKNDNGSADAGQTYLIFGNTTGWSTGYNLSKTTATFIGESSDDSFGYSVSGAGDVNGDGYDDILIGAPFNDEGGVDAGQSYLILGKSSGWLKETDLSNVDASFIGEASDDRCGNWVAGAGDVNGDGYDDLLIGAFNNDEGGSNSGQTYLFLGKASGWSLDTDLSNADMSFIGEGSMDFSGRAIATAGDVNGDGYDDILTGADNNRELGVVAGQAYLIFPDINTMPTVISSVKAYSDSSYTNEITTSFPNDSVFIELIGTDGNISRRDIAVVNISSSKSPMGFSLRMLETGMNTGKYRGEIIVKNRTHRDYHWINALPGETIWIDSKQDPLKNATISIITRLLLYPLKDELFVQEDEDYNIHYWTINRPNVDWSFESNSTWLSWNQSTKDVTGTPENGDVGSYWVRINISHNRGDSDEHFFILIVNNTPPLIKTENKLDTFEDLEYRMDYNSSDDNQGIVMWSLTTDADDWLNMNTLTGEVNGTPTNNHVGFYSVNISVNDGNGGSDWSAFTLTVRNTNDPPIITTDDMQIAYEDQEYLVTYNVTDDDVTDTDFNWNLSTNASWLEVEAEKGILNGTPENEDVGEYFVNISVKDTLEEEDFHNFSIEVVNTNDIPIWENIPNDVQMYQGEIYLFNIKAKDIDIGDIITYKIETEPITTMTINSITGEINWTPETPGQFSINISATDGIETIFHEIGIKVLQVGIPGNTPPIATLISPKNGDEIDILNPMFKWTVFDNEPDNITSSIYYSKILSEIENLDIIALVKTNLTTTSFTVTTPLEKGKQYYWTVIPFDSKENGDCMNGFWSFKTKASASINNPPILEPIPNQIAYLRKEFTYNVTGKDDNPVDKLIFSLETSPEGMGIDTSTGIITWTPTSSQIGIHTIVIRLSDGIYSTNTTFNIEVKEINKPLPRDPTLDDFLPAILIIIIGLIIIILVWLRKRNKGQIQIEPENKSLPLEPANENPSYPPNQKIPVEQKTYDQMHQTNQCHKPPY